MTRHLVSNGNTGIRSMPSSASFAFLPYTMFRTAFCQYSMHRFTPVPAVDQHMAHKSLGQRGRTRRGPLGFCWPSDIAAGIQFDWNRSRLHTLMFIPPEIREQVWLLALAVSYPHSRDWLHALPVSCVCLAYGGDVRVAGRQVCTGTSHEGSQGQHLQVRYSGYWTEWLK